MLEKIKLDLGITDTENDGYLTMKIDEALVRIDLYTNENTDNIPDALVDMVIKDLVIEQFNKRGLEGIGYHSEGGAVYTFSEKTALSKLNNYCKPKLVGTRNSNE